MAKASKTTSGVVEGSWMTTIHALHWWPNPDDQQRGGDLAVSRWCCNIVPLTQLVLLGQLVPIPELNGKLDGFLHNVFQLNWSLTNW